MTSQVQDGEYTDVTLWSKVSGHLTITHTVYEHVGLHIPKMWTLILKNGPR